MTVSASKARSDFYSLLDSVYGKFKKVVITNKGKARAILMDPGEFASWEETMEVIADKKLVKDILKSEREIKKGETVSERNLMSELKISPKEV